MPKAIDQNVHFKYKKDLAKKIRAKQAEISAWYRKHAKNAPPPFYCSVDLRDSGLKIVPVDSNMYPAGFNNICPEDQRTAPQALKDQIESQAAQHGIQNPKKILILPEFHTTNTYYIENLYYLNSLVEHAGFETKIGWISEAPPSPVGSPIELKSASEKRLQAYNIQVSDTGELSADGFVPDLILLNNDFSGGYPPVLDLVKQPIVPSHKLGWHVRKKSEHFKYYNQLAREFAELTGIDPWVFEIETEEVDHVNFNEGEGIDRVAESVSRMITKIKAGYDQHGVKEKPFVFVKNNAGTYGMGIMVVHSAEELLSMNRRTKNKMSVGKNKKAIESIAVQEGIPTTTLVDRLPSEPVIYLVGCELIGGFLRTNTERGTEDNLNSQGMVFRKLCMSDLREDSEDISPADEPVLELVYGSIARISALATGLELKDRLG
jgi:glutamate--cysteine ligase